MIKRDLIITVNGEESKLNNQIYVYQGDSGIVLSFEIIGLNYEFDKATTNIIDKYNPVSCSVIFKKPDGSKYNIPKSIVKDGKLLFTITSNMTDQFEEIGTYLVQFKLYDVHDHVLTIPPINFTVKPLINNPAITDGSNTDNNNTAEDPEEILDDYGNDFENRYYNKKDWIVNELIRSYDLNRMEEAIDYLVKNSGIDIIKDDVVSLLNTWSSSKIKSYIDNKSDIVLMTRSQYDNLEDKNPKVLYIIINE